MNGFPRWRLPGNIYDGKMMIAAEEIDNGIFFDKTIIKQNGTELPAIHVVFFFGFLELLTGNITGLAQQFTNLEVAGRIVDVNRFIHFLVTGKKLG